MKKVTWQKQHKSSTIILLRQDSINVNVLLTDVINSDKFSCSNQCKSSNSVQGQNSFSFSAVTLLVGQQEEHPACKMNSVLVCWWWRFDWNFARLTAPVITTNSFTLSSDKIQNGNILVPANPSPPGKWPLNRRQKRWKLTTTHSLDVLPLTQCYASHLSDFIYGIPTYYVAHYERVHKVHSQTQKTVRNTW